MTIPYMFGGMLIMFGLGSLLSALVEWAEDRWAANH